MTEIHTELTVQEEPKLKKIVDRSASYPTVTLTESFTFVAEIFKNFPTGNPIITREDVAAIFKTKTHNIQRDVACAAQFNFLKKEKGGYEISSAFRTLRNSFDNEKPKLW